MSEVGSTLELARRGARAAAFASAVTVRAARVAAVREVDRSVPVLAVGKVLPAESAPAAEDIAPVVVEPAPVLAVDHMAPAAIDPAGSSLAAADIALVAVAHAEPVSAMDVEPASSGTSRSTPAAAARFSSSPMVE